MKNIITLILLMAAIAIMLKLGFWQIQRLEWKSNIIAEIDQQESIDPMKTPLDLSDDTGFQRGYLTGAFIDASVVIISPRTHDGQVGSHVVQAFQTKDHHTILVNMGWVPAAQPSTATIPAMTIPNKIKRIGGYLKSPDPKTAFTPQNNPDQNRWYWMDMDALSTHFHINPSDIYPKVLYLEKPQLADIIPFQGLPHPRNKHAQYAFFWFGMAGLLGLLSIFYIWKNRIKRKKA